MSPVIVAFGSQAVLSYLLLSVLALLSLLSAGSREHSAERFFQRTQCRTPLHCCFCQILGFGLEKFIGAVKRGEEERRVVKHNLLSLISFLRREG